MISTCAPRGLSWAEHHTDRRQSDEGERRGTPDTGGADVTNGFRFSVGSTVLTMSDRGPRADFSSRSPRTCRREPSCDGDIDRRYPLKKIALASAAMGGAAL